MKLFLLVASVIREFSQVSYSVEAHPGSEFRFVARMSQDLQEVSAEATACFLPLITRLLRKARILVILLRLLRLHIGTHRISGASELSLP